MATQDICGPMRLRGSAFLDAPDISHPNIGLYEYIIKKPRFLTQFAICVGERLAFVHMVSNNVIPNPYRELTVPIQPLFVTGGGMQHHAPKWLCYFFLEGVALISSTLYFPNNNEIQFMIPPSNPAPKSNRSGS